MPPSAAVVGRERELAVIESFLVAEPCPRALVVDGEPGAGKTTLLRAAIARAPDAQVLACWPAPGESALSFVALGDLLRPHLVDVLPALPRPQRRALAGALYLDEATDDVAGAHVVGAATLNALGLLAARRPALLVVDDGQWLDAASAEVLAWVVRRLPERLPVRVVLARRTSPEPLPLDLERALDDALLTRLAPEPLDADATYVLVRERLGVVLGPAELRRVHELSGGNPFFALELARAGADGGLPGSLAGLVEGRLSRLPDQTVRALAACAYLARPTLDIVSAATDGDAWTLLAPALDDGVVEVADGAVRFSHPLLAEGARERVPVSQQRSLHSRLAGVVGSPEERARHLAGAHDPPNEDVAAAAEEGARLAFARGAPAAASELIQVAWRFGESNDETIVRRVMLATAVFDAAGGPLHAMVDDAAARLGRGPQRARVLAALSKRCSPAQEQALHPQIVAEAEGDPTVLTLAWDGLANSYSVGGDWAAGARAHRMALEFADRADPIAAAQAYAAAGTTALLRAEPDAGDLLRTAEQLERRSGARLPAQLSPQLGLAMAWIFADRLDEARHLAEARLQLALAEGDEGSEIVAAYHLAELEWRAGNWDRARTLGLRSYHLTERDDHPDFAAAVRWIVGLVDAGRGVFGARVTLEHGLHTCTESGLGTYTLLHVWALGFLELAAGDPARALVHLDAMSGLWESMGLVEQGVSHHASDELEALILVGREADAERRIDEEAERAEALDRDRLRGVVDRARGMLASRRGQHSEAVEALLRAEALHGAGPLPFDHGRTLLALGEAQRRAGRRRDARTSLQSAGAIFERLGARPWSVRTDAELGRLGGRVASGDELTATEQRVAVLVAEGRTNREVAAELVVSVRAVEANLTRVYAKLGVRSRAELAARFRG